MPRSERDVNQPGSERSKRSKQPGQLRGLNARRSIAAQLGTERRIIELVSEDPNWTFSSIARQIHAEGGACCTPSGVRRAYYRALGRHAQICRAEQREQSQRICGYVLNRSLVALVDLRTVIDAGHFDVLPFVGLQGEDEADVLNAIGNLEDLLKVMAILHGSVALTPGR